MRIGYVCRWCKGPPLPKPPEGKCPNCHGFYRHDQVRLRDDEINGAEMEDLSEGKPVTVAAAQAAHQSAEPVERISTGLRGFDWVFGGGFCPGKTVSFCGGEGSGKTSLLWRVFIALAKRKVLCLLNSSEQSVDDLVEQFARFGPVPQKYFLVVHQTDRDKILRLLERESPQVFALDSVHDVDNVTDESGFSLSSGGERAVHFVAKEIRRLSRELGCASLLNCHMNSDGTMKGGTSLRHEVDGTLMLERPPEEDDPQRFLKFKKYRYAPPNRKARFQMLDNDFKDCGPLIAKPEPPAIVIAKKPDLRLVEDD